MNSNCRLNWLILCRLIHSIFSLWNRSRSLFVLLLCIWLKKVTDLWASTFRCRKSAFWIGKVQHRGVTELIILCLDDSFNSIHLIVFVCVFWMQKSAWIFLPVHFDCRMQCTPFCVLFDTLDNDFRLFFSLQSKQHLMDKFLWLVKRFCFFVRILVHHDSKTDILFRTRNQERKKKNTKVKN